MSTKRISSMGLLSADSITGAETLYRCQDLSLQSFAPLIVRLLLAEAHQVLPHHGRDGRIRGRDEEEGDGFVCLIPLDVSATILGERHCPARIVRTDIDLVCPLRRGNGPRVPACRLAR